MRHEHLWPQRTARTEHNARRLSDEVISFPLMPGLRRLSGVVLFSLLLGISVLCVYVEMVARVCVGGQCVHVCMRKRGRDVYVCVRKVHACACEWACVCMCVHLYVCICERNKHMRV